MPDQIFISYRRDDAAYVTGHINDRLRKEFGEDYVFTDVDRIALGVDFRATLDLMVSDCQILLAVIGGDWLTVKNQDGQLRLQDPADFVRIEIESALKRNIPVIPLLVSGAKMPTQADLPDSLKDFAFRNGTQIRPAPDFHTDIDRLINSLRKHLNTAPEQPGEEKPGRAKSDAERRDEKELKRLLAEVKRKREEDRSQSDFPDANVKLENEEKARKQTELQGRDRGKKLRPLAVLGLLVILGASGYVFVQYQEQVQATNAALERIQKDAADAETKRQADAKAAADAIAAVKLKAEADAEAKRQADAIAEAVAEAEANVEARFKAEANADAIVEAESDAEAQLKSDADAEAELKAKADAEARRRAAADAETKRKLDASTFIREGVSLSGYGDYEAAIQNFDAAIGLNAQPAFVYKQRGAAYHALGNYEAAVRDYDEAIRLSPGDVNAFYKRGASHHALLDYPAAILDCDEAIRLDPEFADVYYIRGTSYEALGNQEAADRDFAIAAELNLGR